MGLEHAIEWPVEAVARSEQQTQGPGWARWITLASLPVALVALIWTVHSVGLASLVHRFLALGPWLFVVIAVEVLVTACDAAAIHAFLGEDGRKEGYLHVAVAQVAGRAINVITPLASVGEVVKVALLVERVPQASAVAAVLLYDLAGNEISFVLMAVGAPLTAAFMPMPQALRLVLYIAGAVAAVVAVALPVLVRRGVLSSFVGVARALRILGQARVERWRKKLVTVDGRLKDGSDERKHQRTRGFVFLLGSRALTWVVMGLLIHAAGGHVSFGFLAAIVTAGQVITWVATLVPLGIGVAEGGNYALFLALGANPAVGVTVALGRRVTHILYAAIGVTLVSVSQTVKKVRARRRH
jgi:uncharacterized protein (TIRG00374 family)